MEKEAIIPLVKVSTIVGIFFPWGYSYHRGLYTGVSPYLGKYTNTISLAFNEYAFGAAMVIIMQNFNEECDENEALGFYKGVMKMIAPELYSDNSEFKGANNVIRFDVSKDDDCISNAFGADIALL